MSHNHAIVVGASLAGLVAARVLSDHFASVTVLDRDSLPRFNENRRGVPQGRHGHGLLASGLRALNGLFPGLEKDLVKGGSVPGDVIGNVRWFQHGCYKVQFQSGLNGCLMSRPLLEGAVRERVRRLANVHIVEDAHVSGLAIEGDRVTGVHLHESAKAGTRLDAALVIDATGRSSRSPEWLIESGFEAPEVEAVEIDLGYTTRTYPRRSGDLGGDVAALIAPRPPHERRVGFMLAMEGDRWIVTLGGWLGEHAPTERSAYTEFARSLGRPDIYEVIKDAEPLTDAVIFKFPSNLRRRYERLAQFPARFLVIGDAVCSFNPVYGQGMSVAALEGEALAATLRKQPTLDGLWQPFYRAASRVIDTPWMIAAGSDFAFAGVSGQKPRGTDFVNWYLDRVHRAASRDRFVCRAFFDVANLLAPATRLFRPDVVARVARGAMARSTPNPPRAQARGAAASSATPTSPLYRLSRRRV